MIKECGYIYVASISEYIKEAINSAVSLRRVDKQAQITLIAGQDIEGLKDGPFDQVIIHPVEIKNPSDGWAYRAKHQYEYSPYQKTIYLDTDTYIYENPRALFELLDYFDIGMVLAPNNTDACSINGKRLSTLTIYNTGVMAYRKNHKNSYLFETYNSLYNKKEYNTIDDQSYLMHALIVSESRIFTLQNIWNARIPFYINLKGPVKIVHGRSDNYEKLRLKLNSTIANRSWDPFRQKCIYRQSKLSRPIKYYLKNPQKVVSFIKRKLKKLNRGTDTTLKI